EADSKHRFPVLESRPTEAAGPGVNREFRRATATIAICFVVLVVCLWALLSPTSPQLDPNTIAVVNNKRISAEEYFDALAALFIQQTGSSPTLQQRQQVLDDLVDQRLMLQQVNELGLVGTHEVKLRQFRKQVILAGVQEPDETQLRRFYDDHPSLFTKHKSYHIDPAWFFGENSSERALFALTSLEEGADFAAIHALADEAVVKVPDGPLPPSTLRNYIGPSAVAALEDLEIGEWSKPLSVAGGHLVVLVVDIGVGQRQPLEEVRLTLERLCRKQIAAQVTEEFIDNLRAEASIVKNRALVELEGAALRQHLEKAYAEPLHK
ncbi:MAG: peptidyl-prolyl cis-trans isomerase, partial [Proteobacteria bacterium]|nr:peptidyl-prolyl cis-trans isomerase [Pseudomonadota bacterium]